MAYYNKIGLLVLNRDSTKFLVCEPGGNYGKDTKDYKARKVRQYIMPGGQMNKGEKETEALKREIREELGCGILNDSIKFIGEYLDISATSPDRDVSIRLYQGKLSGNPKLTAEIGGLHWIGKDDTTNENISPIIKNKIIGDLYLKGILH